MAIQSGSIISASDINTLINNIKTVCNVYGHGLNYDIFDPFSAGIINDRNNVSTGYTNNSKYTKVITISGATKLRITVTYQTQGLSNDWGCIWKGNYPSYTAQNNWSSSFTGKLGGTTLSIKKYEVSGDTVTCSFRSDGSTNNFYGFHVIVEDADISKNINLSSQVIRPHYFFNDKPIKTTNETYLELEGNLINDSFGTNGISPRATTGSNIHSLRSQLGYALTLLNECVLQSQNRKFTTGNSILDNYKNSTIFTSSIGWEAGYPMHNGCIEYNCCNYECEEDESCSGDCCNTDCGDNCCNGDANYCSCEYDETCYVGSGSIIKPNSINSISNILSVIQNDYCTCNSNTTICNDCNCDIDCCDEDACLDCNDASCPTNSSCNSDCCDTDCCHWDCTEGPTCNSDCCYNDCCVSDCCDIDCDCDYDKICDPDCNCFYDCNDVCCDSDGCTHGVPCNECPCNYEQK